MVEMVARIQVPDDAGYAEIEEAKIAAKWNVVSKETKADRMRKTNLEGKCGSCRWFTACAGTSIGDCKNFDAPVSVRWSRSRTTKCQAYEKRII